MIDPFKISIKERLAYYKTWFFNKHIYFSHKEHFRMIFERLLFQFLIHFIQTMNIKALNLSEIVGK